MARPSPPCRHAAHRPQPTPRLFCSPGAPSPPHTHLLLALAAQYVPQALWKSPLALCCGHHKEMDAVDLSPPFAFQKSVASPPSTCGIFLFCMVVHIPFCPSPASLLFWGLVLLFKGLFPQSFSCSGFLCFGVSKSSNPVRLSSLFCFCKKLLSLKPQPLAKKWQKILLLVKPPPPLLSLRTLPCSAWLGPSPPHTRDTRKAAQSLALRKPQLGAVGWAGSLAHQPSSD